MSLNAKFEVLSFDDAEAALQAPEDAGRPRTLVVFSGAELALGARAKALLKDAQAQIERALDELAQREVINTGLILAPNVRFYPVSLDRFITEILDQEFRP